MSAARIHRPIQPRPSSQSAILRMIYRFGPITRPELADYLGLTRPTITTAVRAMIDGGLVREISLTDPADAAGPGRKAHPVDICPACRYFVGAEMRGTVHTVCITDYRGHVVLRKKSLCSADDYRKHLEAMGAMITDALESAPIPREKIAGIGLCVPGLVDQEAGILKNAPGTGWGSRNLRRDLSRLLDDSGPVVISNNACARALGAQLFQKGTVTGRSFAYLFISSGIACPLLLNTGSPIDSLVGFGEAGHMVLDPDGPRCRCGRQGCLEAFSGDLAVLAACEEVRRNSPVLKALCPEGPLTMEVIGIAQRQQDPLVCSVISKAVEMLGIGISNICNFSCPDTMLIEGFLFESEDNRRALLEAVSRNLCVLSHSQTEFRFLHPDDYSGAVGAAAAAVAADLNRDPF